MNFGLVICLTAAILMFSILNLIPSVSAQDYAIVSNISREGYGILFIFILLVIIIGLLIGKRHRYVRKYFTAEVKRKILKRQCHKCAKCNWNAGVFDFDHKDGNRSNNKMSNCQELCPNCHARKSRGIIEVKTKSRFSVKVAFLFFFLLFMILVFSHGLN
jgi:hypothetical protein